MSSDEAFPATRRSGTALVVTVGGSHQPLLLAIEQVEPEFIVFICSADDFSGAKGSYTQVEGAGSCIKSHPADAAPSLPNIPVQAGYNPEQIRVRRIRADDIDDAYSVINRELGLLLTQYRKVVCDYTGGTKSMSSALVVAAFEHNDVSVQMVTGLRSNLEKVEHGRGRVRSATYLSARFSREIQAALAHWNSYAYSTSASLLEAVQPSATADHDKLDVVLTMCRAFAAWDVFDHEGANREFSLVGKLLGRQATQYFAALNILVKPGVKQEPARILDLWRNAQRCAARARYDDSTSRAYRLIEWCGQWLLRHYCDGLESDRISATRIPEGMQLSRSARHEGYFQASLSQVWQLFEYNCADQCGDFWLNNASRLRGVLQSRNESVLAHGFRPVTSEDWALMESFVQDCLLPEMMRHFAAVKISMMPQLPDHWSGEIAETR